MHSNTLHPHIHLHPPLLERRTFVFAFHPHKLSGAPKRKSLAKRYFRHDAADQDKGFAALELSPKRICQGIQSQPVQTEPTQHPEMQSQDYLSHDVPSHAIRSINLHGGDHAMPSELEVSSLPLIDIIASSSTEPVGITQQALQLEKTVSSKDSTRVFALMWLCLAYLPTNRPDWVPPLFWGDLLILRERGKLIQIVVFGKGALIVRIPEIYDIIIHSRANYGPSLRKWTESLKTRYRWWSDSSVKYFHPIKNNRVSEHEIERMITLPVEITENPYLQSLFRDPSKHGRLLAEISGFFANLLHQWINKEEIEVLDLLGFGRTRRKPHAITSSVTEGFSSVLQEAVHAWNQKEQDDSSLLPDSSM